MRIRTLDYIFLTLLVIGGINWGLLGLFNFNLVTMLFGNSILLTNIIYILVGISAIYSIMFYSYFTRRDEVRHY
ncbi:MAG: DUF378 domain-containing protein [Lachnospirales bacterium]